MGRHGHGRRGQGHGPGRCRGGRSSDQGNAGTRDTALPLLGPSLRGTGLPKEQTAGSGRGAEELARLRQQAQAIEQQLTEVRSRLSAGLVSAPRRVAIVNRDSCTICGICALSCPRDAIKVNGFAEVDASLCSGCGACVSVCPSRAIQLGRP